jgi:hypothetical protein
MKKPKKNSSPKQKKPEENNFIFSPKESSKPTQDNQYYTLVGQEDFIDQENNPRIEKDDNRVLAKKTLQNKLKYLIKLDNAGKFYNPLSPISSIKPIKILQTISLYDNRFKEVNQTAFNMYLNFLRSKNIAWINNAEREVF